MHEIQVLSKLNGHANIVTYYDSWVEEIHPWNAQYKLKESTTTQTHGVTM